MNPSVIQHDHDLPLDMAEQVLEEPDDVPTVNRSGLRVLQKRPSDVIAPIVDSFSQFAGSVTKGVTPLVDHVRRRTPFNENPTSSR